MIDGRWLTKSTFKYKLLVQRIFTVNLLSSFVIKIAWEFEMFKHAYAMCAKQHVQPPLVVNKTYYYKLYQFID